MFIFLDKLTAWNSASSNIFLSFNTLFKYSVGPHFFMLWNLEYFKYIVVYYAYWIYAQHLDMFGTLLDWTIKLKCEQTFLVKSRLNGLINNMIL